MIQTLRKPLGQRSQLRIIKFSFINKSQKNWNFSGNDHRFMTIKNPAFKHIEPNVSRWSRGSEITVAAHYRARATRSQSHNGSGGIGIIAITGSTIKPWSQGSNSFKKSVKGTQDWEFFWLRIWILYYFIVSYAQILRFCKKVFLIGPWMGEIRLFRLVWD